MKLKDEFQINPFLSYRNGQLGLIPSEEQLWDISFSPFSQNQLLQSLN